MFVTADCFANTPTIAHGFFTRQGGVSEGLFASLNCGYGSGDKPERVHENRLRISHVLGSDTEIVTCFQIHSATAVVAGMPWEYPDSPKADAIVTSTPGMAIAVLTADCAPILLADPEAGVIAAAHAGWKGAFSGILQATVDLMESIGARRERIAAAIGPCIAQASYEVGPEFITRFISEFPENERFFTDSTRLGYGHFDLKAYAESRLRAAGVNQIDLLPQDTRALADEFFSYRRTTLDGDPVYGRQASAIMLK